MTEKPKPIVHEIPYTDPAEIFAVWADKPGSILFDSAARSGLGRYSFIAAAPFAYIQGADPLALLQQQLDQFPLATHPDLPPFQGGAAGFLSYEFARYLEAIPQAKADQDVFPDYAISLYDLVLAFDHVRQQAFLFSSGYPFKDEARLTQAYARLDWFLTQNYQHALIKKDNPKPVITANFTQPEYEKAVAKVIKYIYSGDIFEANLSQRFSAALADNFDHYALYKKLRQLNPAPFAAFVNLGDMVIASASPERFLQVIDKKVETRPIKGTCKRHENPAIDAQLANELVNSEKDHAENIMIVDLLRNDLSKVCEPHSVQVPQLCALESYATVHHLVSVVTGTLSKDKTAVDLLKASFPGGSITGAPKIRAMQIIAELEPHVRGPYCGSLFYIGFDGTMDSSILIRTCCIKEQHIYLSAGGAITADSDPKLEYEETLIKAAALMRALGQSW